MELKIQDKQDLVLMLQAFDTMRLRIIEALRKQPTNVDNVDKPWFNECCDEYDRLTYLRTQIVEEIKNENK